MSIKVTTFKIPKDLCNVYDEWLRERTDNISEAEKKRLEFEIH